MASNNYICHIGPGEEMPGGMLSVIKSYMNNTYLNDYNQIHITTVAPKKKLLKFLSGTIKLVNLLVNKQISLTYIHMSERGSCYRTIIFVLLCNLFSTPAVVHSHGGEIETWYEKENKISRKLFKLAMNNADLVIVLTPGWKRFWNNILLDESKIRVIPNYVDYRNYEARTYLKNGYFNVLFLGYIGTLKGTYDLVKATKVLLDNNIPIQLHIGGNGEIEKCKQLVEELNLSNNVRVYGWIDGDRKEKLMDLCDVLALPSNYESFGIVLLEAMIHQIPVICGSNGYSKEIIDIGSTGYVARSGDYNDLSKCLIDLYDKNKLKIMGDNAYKHVINCYTKKTVSTQIRDVFDLFSKKVR